MGTQVRYLPANLSKRLQEISPKLLGRAIRLYSDNASSKISSEYVSRLQEHFWQRPSGIAQVKPTKEILLIRAPLD